MVEVDPDITLIGPHGTVTLLDAFEGRRQLLAYYFMWHTGQPAPEQCEGCTWVTTQVRELSYLHSRDVTFAVFCQGPYEESSRYREFMGWTCLGIQRSGRSTYSWSDAASAECTSFATCGKATRCSRPTGLRYEAPKQWITATVCDLTVYGRQEKWEDSTRLATAVFHHADQRRIAHVDASASVAGRGAPSPSGPV